VDDATRQLAEQTDTLQSEKLRFELFAVGDVAKDKFKDRPFGPGQADHRDINVCARLRGDEKLGLKRFHLPARSVERGKLRPQQCGRLAAKAVEYSLGRPADEAHKGAVGVEDPALAVGQHNPVRRVGDRGFETHALVGKLSEAVEPGDGPDPVQVSQWKKEAAERLPEVFARKADQNAQEAKEREKELFEEIGRLKMELEWLKKKLASSSVEERRRMMEPQHPALPITRQCELLGLARASYYHQPEPESDENLRLMRVIDETYLAYPVFGSRQMTRWLRRQGIR